MISSKEPAFFSRQSDLRKWFEKNHNKETELLVGFYKVGSGKPSITWSQSVDEALCFGWIDGVRKSINADSYCIRFTPRKHRSIWSSINIKKVQEFTRKGLMRPAGLAAFEKREDSRSKIYSFEQKHIVLDERFQKIFRANKKAWTYFKSQAPSYQRTAIWLVISAKQEETRLKRLYELIKDSENEQYVKALRRPVKSK